MPDSPDAPAVPPSTIEVVVAVDFGPADRPAETHRVAVPAGATALEATCAALPVELGFVCCSERDVAAIRGVACDPALQRWWYYGLNGDPGPVSAHRQPLAAGDRITWRFMSRSAWRDSPWPRDAAESKAGPIRD